MEVLKMDTVEGISKEEFCSKTRTPKDWHIFTNKDLEFFEFTSMGRTFQRCIAKTIGFEWIFTRVENEIWVKCKNKDANHWSEWYDWF